MQPTGKLHIGNYFGALKNWVELQNSGRYQCYFFVADLHSITAEFDPAQKYKQTVEVVADYIAAGISPEKSVIFVQSQIPEHSELAWVLNCITPFGELRRMTQFKDKSASQSENINIGLFDYPVLMAADVLLYDTSFVPVGDDQLQHLELTRTIARKFNSQFKKIMQEPEPLLTEVPRLMSLSDPLRKMSKSMPEGCLFLDDAPDIIRDKVKRAVTDSEAKVVYNPTKKPGVANLIRIYRGFTNLSVKEIERKYADANYGVFKRELAEVIVEGLRPFQVRKKLLMKKSGEIDRIIEKGRKKAQKKATEKMNQVKETMGLSKKVTKKLPK
ncbi:MAG: Tryptophan-tRNA ligase [Candidatus Wolfebacteria bacterium GW2011_GWC2_39_22]|uniref:Tryptophan--tRNA ligase n=2 Tax=Candidatus Wolfeibacteriota TaxID=1752735 RepID=A0A0G1HAC8_9BACT|nr:MAG: Tryptophan-tRNA ligase [Candidatus Wolfebacteria bacterium GW2011_GWC2_39_22]KKT43503.1 MAG: Tryptophan-tRNA ligase [Candidatus Wolfebacteria bacterium GW2011_GWE2_44_13]